MPEVEQELSFLIQKGTVYRVPDLDTIMVFYSHFFSGTQKRWRPQINPGFEGSEFFL